MSPVVAPPRVDRPYPRQQRVLTGCSYGGPFTVDGFARYQNTVTSLPPLRQRRLSQIAQAIVRSYGAGCRPIRTVQVYGHADWDTPRNFQREMRVSQQRADRM